MVCSTIKSPPLTGKSICLKVLFSKKGEIFGGPFLLMLMLMLFTIGNIRRCVCNILALCPVCPPLRRTNDPVIVVSLGLTFHPDPMLTFSNDDSFLFACSLVEIGMAQNVSTLVERY
jgi:hypothetical protein